MLLSDSNIFFIVFSQYNPEAFLQNSKSTEKIYIFFLKHLTEILNQPKHFGLGFKWNGFRNEVLCVFRPNPHPPPGINNHIWNPFSVMHVWTGCVEPQPWDQQPYMEYPYRWYQHAWLLKSYVLAIFDIRVEINHQGSASVQVRLH